MLLFNEQNTKYRIDCDNADMFDMWQYPIALSNFIGSVPEKDNSK